MWRGPLNTFNMKKLFTQDEFYNICKEALSKCEDKTMYDLKNELKKFGFAKINSVAKFEFTEE